jgi:hypothetical protein
MSEQDVALKIDMKVQLFINQFFSLSNWFPCPDQHIAKYVFHEFANTH